MRKALAIKWKPLLGSLLLALGAGLVSAWITGDSRQVYGTLVRPPLAPPAVVFPIVWTALFLLMGVSAHLVYTAAAADKKAALAIYAAQLAVNALWSPIFFKLKLFLFAFIWLVLLWGLVVWMIGRFYQIHKAAAWLQIPYLLWLSFAGYLNWAIYILNR